MCIVFPYDKRKAMRNGYDTLIQIPDSEWLGGKGGRITQLLLNKRVKSIPGAALKLIG